MFALSAKRAGAEVAGNGKERKEPKGGGEGKNTWGALAAKTGKAGGWMARFRVEFKD